MIVAATGHRPQKLGGFSHKVKQDLFEVAMKALVEKSPHTVISGMALGWDQAVARAACNLSIPFIAAIPFPGQADRWPSESVLEWGKLLRKASEVITICETFSYDAMEKRNRYMVDNCDIVIALFDENKPNSGTGRCIAYAKKHRKQIVNYWELYSRITANG